MSDEQMLNLVIIANGDNPATCGNGLRDRYRVEDLPPFRTALADLGLRVVRQEGT